jgi:hypothetical protein
MRTNFRLFHRLGSLPRLGTTTTRFERGLLRTLWARYRPRAALNSSVGPVPIGAGEKKMIAPARRLISVLRRWSRVVRILGPLLVVLLLALMMSGTAARSPLIERYLVYDPSTTLEGAFFALDEEILTDRVATAATEAFGGPAGYERARQRSRGKSSDALTRDYMAAFDGYLTAAITIRFFKGLAVAPDVVNKLLESSKNVIHLPDGSTLDVPLRRALPLHVGAMRIATEGLWGREPPVQLTQAYEASVEGTCPFPAGGIELTQRDFLVEGGAGRSPAARRRHRPDAGDVPGTGGEVRDDNEGGGANRRGRRAARYRPA